MTNQTLTVTPATDVDSVLDEVWDWLEVKDFRPRTMFSGDILNIDWAWRAGAAKSDELVREKNTELQLLRSALGAAYKRIGAAYKRIDEVYKRIDEVYERCAIIAERQWAGVAAKKIREEAVWEGLSCSCGGGWKVGHRPGCPEDQTPVKTAEKLANRMGATFKEGVEMPKVRNLSKGDNLIIEPQPDGFTSETPIRAFTDWRADGNYAVGKGFRPSLAHLTVYLDAMERVEGWSLVQILAGETSSPTFVFRRAAKA